MQDGLHFPLLSSGDCVTAAVVELLAEVGPPMAEGSVIVTFVTGTFSCFGGAWPFSWVGGIGHSLVMNRLAEAETVEGHMEEAFVGFVVMGMMVDVVAGIRAVDITGSMQHFSTNLYLVLSLALIRLSSLLCFFLVILHFMWCWHFRPIRIIGAWVRGVCCLVLQLQIGPHLLFRDGYGWW